MLLLPLQANPSTPFHSLQLSLTPGTVGFWGRLGDACGAQSEPVPVERNVVACKQQLAYLPREVTLPWKSVQWLREPAEWLRVTTQRVRERAEF